jgi:hypothetical protein
MLVFSNTKATLSYKQLINIDPRESTGQNIAKFLLFENNKFQFEFPPLLEDKNKNCYRIGFIKGCLVHFHPEKKVSEIHQIMEEMYNIYMTRISINRNFKKFREELV